MNEFESVERLGMHPRMPRRAYRHLLDIAALGVALFGELAAPAGSALAEAAIDVDVGVVGQVEVGDQVIIRVTITADELIDGEVVVAMRNTGISTQRDIQIASGTTKEFWFALPSMWDASRIDVSVRDDGDEVATKTATARLTDDEIVGVLPRLAARVGELPLDVELAQSVGGASVSAVPIEVVDLGVSALRTYDTLVAAADDLSELSEAQLTTLLTWVSVGGILLLDDATAATELPEQWQPGRNGYAWADLGEVRLTEGAAAGGEWDEIIQPTPVGSPAMTSGSEMMMDPQMDLARRAGLDLPTIAPLAVGIGIYAFVLGPVLYLVLRKARRLTLGWFVIPAVAVLTAAGVAVAGGGALRHGNPASVSFIHESPAGAYQMSSVLTFSSDGGAADMIVPTGWALTQSSSMFWGDGRQVPIEIRRNADGTAQASVALEATQANIRSYSGSARPFGLSTSAGWDGDGAVTGEVTNDSDVTFHDVAVFAGEDEELLGDLAPGATTEFSLKAIRNLRFNWESRGADVWRDAFGADGGMWDDRGPPIDPKDVDSTVEFGVWGAASTDIDLFPQGMVRAVGWTDEIADNLVDGDDVSTVVAVATVAPITSDDDSVNLVTTRAGAVRGPFGFAVRPANDQVIRYLLPAGADPDALFLIGHDKLNIEEISFWDGAQWVEADASDDVIAVPDAALRHGVVLLRTDVDMNVGVQGIPQLTDTSPEADS